MSKLTAWAHALRRTVEHFPAAGFILAMAVPFPVLGDEPELRNWKNFPVPHGTPATERPCDAELLKVLPALRAAPPFSDESRQRGIARWWGDPNEIQFMEQPPSSVDLERRGIIQTPPGEDEPLLLGVWGITRTGPVTLSVEKSPFPLTIRHIEFEPHYVPTAHKGRKTEGGRVLGFATYLPEQGITYVRPGERSVFWINVEVPKGTVPGDYELTFEMIIHQKEVLHPKATVKVLDFELPRADAAFGMYFRPVPKLPQRYRKPNLMRAYWRDMARHGMTSATIYNYAGHIYDDEGGLKIDGNADIQTLKDMMADGLVTGDVPIMWLGSLKEKAAPAIRDEFKRRGWPELLKYSQDEPPVSDASLAYFKAEQPIRKFFRTITAISEHPSRTYADMLDVHVVLVGVISPDLQAHLKSHGAEVWTYTYHFRGRGNVPQQRFYAGLYTWALGLKGNFLWCYTEGYAWEGDRYDAFCQVLPSDSGPVPSAAWEGRREGVEDYRTLRYLESLIAADPQRTEAKEAKTWLEQIRGRVDWYLARDMPVSDYPWDSCELYPMCPNFEPRELSEVRATAVQHIQNLSVD